MSRTWKLTDRDLILGNRTLVMGILNVTPDSFSDGGRFVSLEDAVAAGHRLVRAGADILDVGGESTRPGARPVPAREELDRVLPVIEALAATTDVPISVDTQKAVVAAAALERGASIVNDVSALRGDPAMLDTVAGTPGGLVVMHMRGTPATMQDDPAYADVVEAVAAFFRSVLAQTDAAGIDRERIVLDPGIGFGKTLAHNLRLIANADAFAALERPLLIGASRKSMFDPLLGGAGVDERLEASLAAASVAAFLGVDVLRVHDVAETVRAIRVADALGRHRDTDRSAGARPAAPGIGVAPNAGVSS